MLKILLKILNRQNGDREAKNDDEKKKRTRRRRKIINVQAGLQQGGVLLAKRGVTEAGS